MNNSINSTNTSAGPDLDSDTITWILQNCRNIAVVGLSPKTHRASFDVAHYLQAQGFRIIPVNPNAHEVLGERAYSSLLEAAQHERIDLVNCFRNSVDIPPVVDDALAIGAKAVWMQLGVRDEASAAKAWAAGLKVVQDRCLKIDHRDWLMRGLISPLAPLKP